MKKMRNRFLLLKATYSPCFKQCYPAVPSQKKNLNFQTSQLHSHWHRWSKRNITGLRNQSELAPSHVENTDYVPQIYSSSDAPQVSNRQPDLEEEEWCPNLQFDSSKPEVELEVGHISLSSAIFPRPPTCRIFPAGTPCRRKCSQQVFCRGNQTIHQPLMEMDVGILHGTHWKGHTEGCTQAKRSSICLKDGHDAFGCRFQWFLAF